MENADLLNDFVIECNENISQIDNDLVKLEQNPKDLEILNKIFRAIHTVKGASGMFGLTRLEKIAHAAEDVLNKMREGKLLATTAHIGPILLAVDVIKEMLIHLDKEKKELAGDDSAIIHQLHAILKGEILPDSSEATNAVPGDSGAAAKSAPAGGSSIPASVSETSLRVHVDVLDRLMNMVGELVLTRNQLVQLIRGVDESTFLIPIHQLNRVTSLLQESVMQTRMQPVGAAWSKLPRIIRDLSQTTGKKLELVMIGQETEIDRQILQAIGDPLVHCVRNSADHGIEKPEVREKLGKPATGTVTLRAFHEGGQIVIEIKDDGAGIDAQVIRNKAIERGLVTKEAGTAMPDFEVLKFIFEPGFSTAKQVTEVSGRGVGMDVVRSNITKIGGSIDIITAVGVGTTLRVKIPLTLAIVSALIIRVGDLASDAFALPQSSVLELVRITPESASSIEQIQDSTFLRLRDALLPLIDLRTILGFKPTDPSLEFSVVVCQIGESRFGLMVQEIFDTQEVVVKAPGHYLRELNIYSGATILGDGRVILILDVARISELGLNGIASIANQSANNLIENEAALHRDRTQLLLFKSCEGANMGVPLSLVSRLEEVGVDKIETADGRLFVQYRGTLLPLLGTQEGWTNQKTGSVPAVIFSDGQRSMGLAVSEIRDVVECALTMESEGTKPGILGAAIIEKQVTEIIDIYHYLVKAYPDWFKNRGSTLTQVRKRKILLVDDSSFFRDLLKPLLESAGYLVVSACDGEDALAAYDRAGPFDLILTDIEMPKKDGWGLAAALRDRGVLVKTPLFALTTLNDDASKKRAQDLGFKDYLVKFDQDQLLNAVAKGLS